MKKIKAGIIGGAGYTGGEVLRLLLGHPNTSIEFVYSRSQAGKPVYHIHHDLLGTTDLLFSEHFDNPVDVLFLCLGHGESKQFLAKHSFDPAVCIIDLTQDFRLSSTARSGNRQFVYGFSEMHRNKLLETKSIANPGCFATAIQLALWPLAKDGCLQEAYVTGITGSTGAGQSLSETSHYSWRANNIQAYKTLTHQHLAEIGEQLQAAAGRSVAVHFVPWRGNFTRGIFISATLRCTLTIQEAAAYFELCYAAAPFVIISKDPISLKQVVGTNKALLQLEQQGDCLVVHCVIDNLLKGASGQAVQNMNLAFGLPETTGLQLKANFF
jgi:N-acetyl-gamma-glutamyl-phosphate reductase